MHTTISPSILYWGTPVVIISTLNSDGSPNIAPMSSAFWLGHNCMLGLGATSQTTQNILRTKQCVLNLPSDNMVHHVNALARTTGTNPVPNWKVGAGYEYVKDKFEHSELTPKPSEVVAPPCIDECPVQMEAEVVSVKEMMGDKPGLTGSALAIEVKILTLHVENGIRLEGHANRIDALKWRPMIMSFQQLFGLGEGKLANSRLAEISEAGYRRLTGRV